MLPFEKYAAEHQKLWDTMHIIRDQPSLNAMSVKVNEHKAVYQAVERETGVPWQMIAVIHIREAGLQDVGAFLKGIHNGQPWNKKTTIVPKGVGPFRSWHEAAVHALKMKKFEQIKDWSPAMMISALEPYNGYGYRNKGLRSPYLWASTNHQQRGKYVADGKFNASVMDTQMGCAAMLRFLGVGRQLSSSAVVAPTVVTAVPTVVAAQQYPDFALPIFIIGGLVIAGFVAYRYIKNAK